MPLVVVLLQTTQTFELLGTGLDGGYWSVSCLLALAFLLWLSGSRLHNDDGHQEGLC